MLHQKPNETPALLVDSPTDFPVTELAAKHARYDVTVREIKQKVLPALDDAFAAKLIAGKTLADLRKVIEHDLGHEKEHGRERAKEGQVVQYLHERIQFELPPPLLKSETRRILADLVQRNRERGVTDEMLKGKEKEFMENAAGLAAHRLKTNFILHRIAERENIRVSRDDINVRIREEAARYNLPAEKCARNWRNMMVWTRSPNRFCWVRLLISLRRMLASRQRKNPLLKKKNHECIERKSFPGADSDGRGADGPGRAQLRYLFATTQGSHRFHWNADGRSHRQSCHSPVAVFANGGLQEGHQHLHQFAWWLGNCRPCGL